MNRRHQNWFFTFCYCDHPVVFCLLAVN